MLRAGVRRERRWTIRRIEAAWGEQKGRPAIDQRSLSVEADRGEIPKARKLEAIIGKGIHQAQVRCDTPGSGPIRIRRDAFRVRWPRGARSHLQRAHVTASKKLVQIMRVLRSRAVGGAPRH